MDINRRVLSVRTYLNKTRNLDQLLPDLIT